MMNRKDFQQDISASVYRDSSNYYNIKISGRGGINKSYRYAVNGKKWYEVVYITYDSKIEGGLKKYTFKFYSSNGGSVLYDKYNKGKRSCDIYEGQYRSRWNKYNKGKRSCELWEGRYEGKYNITFNNNINTYNTRFNDTLLTFNKESNYLNSLLEKIKNNYIG